jgi:hypothetical protein
MQIIANFNVILKNLTFYAVYRSFVGLKFIILYNKNNEILKHFNIFVIFDI